MHVDIKKLANEFTVLISNVLEKRLKPQGIKKVVCASSLQKSK